MAVERNISAEGVTCYLDYALLNRSGEVIIATYFERAKAKVKALACTFGKKSIRIGYQKYGYKAEYRTAYKPVNMGYDRFIYATTINKKVGDSYLLTTKEHQKEDLFQHLMTAYKLPLLEQWVDYLFDQLQKKYVLYVEEFLRWNQRYMSDDSRTITLHDRQVPLKELILLDLESLTNEVLTKVVSEGLRKKEIMITDKSMSPLQFENFDSYITGYGASMVANLEKEIETLAPLKGKVEEVAFKTKRLFPPQAACVNGMVALKEAGSRYGLMIEGMGCGKTLQGAGVVDAYFNKQWLKQHPKKDLKALYEEDAVNYRVVMMAPSHLVGKWKAEVLKEIPKAEVTVLDDFSKLIELREKGKKRTGREWYFISKDTAKLGSQYSPIPTNIGRRNINVSYCSSCYEAKQMLVPKRGQGNKARCPECGGRHFFKRDGGYGLHRGLLCPDCGELLLKTSTKLGKDVETPSDMVLKPQDFSQRNATNSVCYHCGTQLWGVDCKPVDCGGEYSEHVRNYKPKWYKISHWKNFSKKNKKSAFVLRGHEKSYMDTTGMAEFEVSNREFGPRKTAPSLYIKKYLKGYFDMCILDECHKYENGGTAQSNAANALMKASEFTLGLTGTICNGKADSFFYLLYMLDSTRMKKMGYEYSDVTRFVEKYGTLETVYENNGTYDGAYNASSRGKQLQSPKVKPGISPLLFTEFLLDKSIFLDLSDLSRYIPKLEEKVELVPLPKEVQASYWYTLDVLKAAIKSKEGRGLLSEVLQFGLSYPDKPYGRKPIMSPSMEDVMITLPDDYEEYSSSDWLLPKEQKLVDLVNQEIEEGRNCFVYCSYTGNGETNVTYRLQEIIEKHCNLRGRVQIMQSTSPKATEREEWIAKKASEGMKVFICNPKAVETGLDFCFWHEGKFYNYPTLIFYQMTYELAVMWQASRRHYRLNQVTDCRTYYLAYENTLQAAAVEIMAEKQVAASAIQGKFSAEGLTAMAKGVDPRLKLAQMLSDNDTSDRNTLSTMFDVLNASNQAEEISSYDSDDIALTYYEVMGYSQEAMEEATENSLEAMEDLFSLAMEETTTPVQETLEIFEEVTQTETPNFAEMDIFDFFNSVSFTEAPTGILPVVTETVTIKEPQQEESKKTSKKVAEIKPTQKATKKAKPEKGLAIGQMDLFDLLGA